MGWLRRKKQEQGPAKADVTILSGVSWQELYNQTEQFRAPVPVETARRIVKALEASEQSADSLGTRIWWLSLWLLIFTVAICGLTLVLVLVEFGFLKGGAHP